MSISRFGKRYREKIDAADLRAAEAEERRANLTPAELVTEAALNYEVLDSVGVALSKALAKGLQEVERQNQPIQGERKNGWFEVSSVRTNLWTHQVVFTVTYDMAMAGYHVKIGHRHDGPHDFFVFDEILNEHSRTTVTFQEWMMKVARALYVLIPSGGVLSTDNTPLSQLDREALEQLDHIGVKLAQDGEWGPQIVPMSDVDAYAEAIESIRRSLGEQRGS